jgi:alcohol dehydrogenase class IV
MSYDFYMPVRIIGGEHVVQTQAQRLRALGQSCLIVTGGSGAKRSGALEETKAALDSVGVRHAVFDRIEQNPKTETCRQAGQAARDCGADFIIGIGGGSALDASKAVALFATHPKLEADDIYKMQFTAAPLPAVGVGTTAGTGSEISGVSVLTDTCGVKHSIKGERVYFKLVLADWRYTASCPFSVTASTALDAFMHAAEGWLGPKCGEVATTFAEACLPKIWQELKRMNQTRELPNDEQRKLLYHASLDAGFTLNQCGTLFPHQAGYILTEHYGVPHGRACAAFFGELFRRAEQYEPVRAASLLSLLDDDRELILRVIDELAACHGLPIDPTLVAQQVKRWQTAPANFLCTPGGFTAQDAEKSLLSL